ncbi:uncharacterized protein LY89DRAFT_288923 [Mollisia scopiformis]|uniref:Uncharacterized protein n=1 Tax=Mollisia scopiformis TaxID=149040 RepID=A0A132BAP9_MOLSC|nr:uncharacterized protein LY89DRAFT_288923 [Mollisia scopiformis]KUJ09490.1 hypothetical protein LY89DRAFT_288923 [Mollisia scopiformis]
MSQPPLATPDLFDWGRHRPSNAAPVLTKLHCILLDATTSAIIASQPHATGPYFAGSRKCCWNTLIQDPTDLQRILAQYGLETVPGIAGIRMEIWAITKDCGVQDVQLDFYCIVLGLWALDGAGRTLLHTSDTTEEVDSMRAVIYFNIPIPTPPHEDILPTVGWACVVGIIAHEVKMTWNIDGSRVEAFVYTQRKGANLNPLESLGYLGGPCLLEESEDDVVISTFRRDPSFQGTSS